MCTGVAFSRPAGRHSFFYTLLLLPLCLLTGTTAMAQAGSRPPQYFDSPQVIAYTRTGSAPDQDGKPADSQPLVPAGVFSLSASTHYLLWVELEQGRLNVLENLGEAGVVLRKRIPISIGKQGIGKRLEGDNKTPVGIYRIENFLADAGLDDYYGVGAYPLNYPNPLDMLESRTGHGIWLHGLPKQAQQRPFLASEGCIVIDNKSLAALASEIGPGDTMVLSTNELAWVPRKQAKEHGGSLKLAMNSWQKAWESRNSHDYLGYYAADFSDLHRNKKQWAAYKSKINSDKKFIKVEVSDVNMVVEPARPDVVNVVFQQNYTSDNFHWHGRKQQLWRQGEGGWKIIYEGDYF